MMNGTGGNTFLAEDATVGDLKAEIFKLMDQIEDWHMSFDEETDVSTFQFEVQRQVNNKICLTVAAKRKKT